MLGLLESVSDQSLAAIPSQSWRHNRGRQSVSDQSLAAIPSRDRSLLAVRFSVSDQSLAAIPSSISGLDCAARSV